MFSVGLPRTVVAGGTPMLDLRTMMDRTVRLREHRKMLFNIVLDQCHRRIQAANSIGRSSIFFEVPREVIGSPSFPYEQLVVYLMFQLKNNGLMVSRWESVKWTNLVWLHISWHPDVVDMEAFEASMTSAKSSSTGLKKYTTRRSRPAKSSVDIMLGDGQGETQDIADDEVTDDVEQERRLMFSAPSKKGRLTKAEREEEERESAWRRKHFEQQWRDHLPPEMRRG